MSVTDVIVYVGFGLSLLSNILHFIAPRTKTTVDDKISEGVDKAKDALPLVGAVVGASAAESKSVEGFKADPAAKVRDHR